jgi:hypothetical protein
LIDVTKDQSGAFEVDGKPADVPHPSYPDEDSQIFLAQGDRECARADVGKRRDMPLQVPLQLGQRPICSVDQPLRPGNEISEPACEPDGLLAFVSKRGCRDGAHSSSNAA